VGLVLVAIGAAMIATPWLAPRVPAYRATLRSVYSNESLFLPVRMGTATAPFAGVALVCAGLATMLPKPWNAWAPWPFLAGSCAVILLAYRCPQRLLPSWLRSDLESGQLAPARPDGFDWAFLLVTGPLMIIAVLTYPAFVVMQLPP
jgi:hypothetical protein